MTNKEAIRQAIDNWQDENYICGNFLYVLNGVGGHDKYEIKPLQVEWFRSRFKLFEVEHNEIRYESLSSILRDIDDMNIDDLKAFKEINKRAERRDSCFKAILKALSK